MIVQPRRPIALTFLRHYLPGHESGGPVRSVENLVNCLGDEVDFRIVTRDRDIRDSRPYSQVKINEWNRVGKALVYYASDATMSFAGVAKLLRDTPHSALYLNSFVGTRFSALPLLARRLYRIPKVPTIVAPRGEFSEGALVLKPWKKVPYIMAMQAMGLHRDVIWQASSDHEAEDIKRVLGTNVYIEIAPDLPEQPSEAGLDIQFRTRRYPLNVLFASRIAPKKNLDFALRVLRKVRVPIDFSIAGPVTDDAYWRKCQKMMDGLPDNVAVKIIGSVAHESMFNLLSSSDLFFFPTRGENYGHVIAEAFAAGVPVLISNTTPWRGLRSAGVGWDLSLHLEDPFVEAIEEAASKTENDYSAWRKAITQYAFSRLSDPAVVEANRRLFVRRFI